MSALAFANVPDDEALSPLAGHGGVAVYGPAWKRATPRDAGAGWDFDDVRDHYLKTLFGVEPAALRASDPARFLELSRAVSGEVMAETFGEWRRADSPCGGALVLWLKDLRAGRRAGACLITAASPSCARATSPGRWRRSRSGPPTRDSVASRCTSPTIALEPLAGRLRVALYRDFEVPRGGGRDRAGARAARAPHARRRAAARAFRGRRPGPTASDRPPRIWSWSRCRTATGELLSQAFRFPVGYPIDPRSLDALGLTGTIAPEDGGAARLTVRSTRFAYGVRVQVPGYVPADDGFGVEPGHERVIALEPTGEAQWPPPAGHAQRDQPRRRRRPDLGSRRIAWWTHEPHRSRQLMVGRRARPTGCGSGLRPACGSPGRRAPPRSSA